MPACQYTTTHLAFICLLVTSGGVGCRQMGESANAARPKPRETAERALTQLDKNADGKIDTDEMAGHPGLKLAAKRIDTNSDGGLDSEEIRTYFQGYRDVGLTLKSLRCSVYMGDQPVPGATVTLEPETFLGEEIKVAKATTDAYGNGSLAAEGAKYPGVQMGIYKVIVSRIDERNGKELIPARYNTQSELGVEVSVAARDELKEGLKLRLKR